MATIAVVTCSAVAIIAIVIFLILLVNGVLFDRDEKLVLVDSFIGEMYQDEMLPAAVEVILETKQASVSMLQRRLKLGYARAARIVDEMEELGIVGPYQGSKPRDILITAEQWEVMRSGGTTQMEFDDLEVEDGPVPEDF